MYCLIPGVCSTFSNLWVLLSFCDGKQNETQRNQHGPKQLPHLPHAQQKQALQVPVPGGPKHIASHTGGSSREFLHPITCASVWQPQAQPQWNSSPGQRPLAGGGAPISAHLQRPVSPHHQPHHQQAAVFPAADLWVWSGCLAGEWQGRLLCREQLGRTAYVQGQSQHKHFPECFSAPGCLAPLSEECG